MHKRNLIDELRCRCCGHVLVQPALYEFLKILTKRCEYVITSGYRCPAHNAAVGGVGYSYHTQGLAADIAPINMPLDEFALLCWRLMGDGTGAVIVYADEGFVHVDCRTCERYTNICGQE